MVAAYLMVVFAVDLGWPYWLSFLLALAGMALVGAIFNLGVYYPLRHRTFLPVIIATIGASILLANSVLAIYGPQPQVLEGWFETPGIQLGPVYLDRPVSADHCGDDDPGCVQLLVSSSTRCSARSCRRTSQDKEMASAARHLRFDHDHDHLHLLGGTRRSRGHSGGADPVRLDPDGIDDRAQSLRRHHHRWVRRRRRRDHRRAGARHHRNLRRGLHLCALQGRLRLPRAGVVSGVPASGHFSAKRVAEKA